MTAADWWPPTLRAEIANLSQQVDDLATERDDLVEQVARLMQSRNDLRAVVKAAYEPAETGQCRKLRYLHRADAERHAIDVAHKMGDETVFNAYQCPICPVHPGYRTRFWHAGHGRSGRSAIRVRDGAAYYGCGCVFGINVDEMVWRCDSHAEGRARVS